MVVAHSVDQNKVFVFDSEEDHRHYSLVEISMATSAAPTFFPIATVKEKDGIEHKFVDGGITRNNPTFEGYKRAKELYGREKLCVISLGCGYEPLFDYPNPEGFLADGKLAWSGIPSLMMGNTSWYTHEITQYVTKLEGDTYYRLNEPLPLALAPMADIATLDGGLKVIAARIVGSEKFEVVKRELVEFYREHYNYYFFSLIEQKAKEIKKPLEENERSLISLKGYNYPDSSRKLTARGLWEIIDFASKISDEYRLEKIDLTDSLVADFQTVYRYMGKIRNLKILNLSNTGLRIEGLKALDTGLKRQLDKLIVRDNPTILEDDIEKTVSLVCSRSKISKWGIQRYLRDKNPSIRAKGQKLLEELVKRGHPRAFYLKARSFEEEGQIQLACTLYGEVAVQKIDTKTAKKAERNLTILRATYPDIVAKWIKNQTEFLSQSKL